MLSSANLSPEFWGEAVMYAGCVHNRLHSSLSGTFSYQKILTKAPSLKYIRVLEFRIYTHIPDQKYSKLENKSNIDVLLGVEAYNRYRALKIAIKHVEFAREVLIKVL